MCRTKVIHNGDNELLARAIHLNYVRHELATHREAAPTPSHLKWERLAENLRESNRDQADDIGRKRAAIWDTR